LWSAFKATIDAVTNRWEGEMVPYGVTVNVCASRRVATEMVTQDKMPRLRYAQQLAIPEFSSYPLST